MDELIICVHSIIYNFRNRDYYHTCYALSGLSISQHQCGNGVTNICNYDDSLVNLTHPLFNISPSGVKRANIFFKVLEKISQI
jgi:prenyltransferase beta subunit